MLHRAQGRHRKRKFVHLVEGNASPRMAKTTRGVLLYSPHASIGLIDSTNVGKSAHQLFGVGGDIPTHASLGEFLVAGQHPDTLIVGISPVGGMLPNTMRRHVLDALEAGLDVWNGLHYFFGADPEFRLAAERGGGTIWDVRKPPEELPVGYGHCMKSKSTICLMVGTDCALGKMTAGLELQRALHDADHRAEFIATGQTGMMITGWGHAVDALPGDFMAGCVEKDCLSVDGQTDYILVEGQGSLIHPGYSPVTLGLMHGCMPDAMILCHQPGRNEISKREHIKIPPLRDVADLYLNTMKLLKPSAIIGVALNTYEMTEADAREAIQATEEELGLPTTDPVRFGCENLIDALETHRRAIGK